MNSAGNSAAEETSSARLLSEENGGDRATVPGRPQVLISRTGMNQNARNALRSLVEHGMLAELWTTLVWDSQSAWNRVLPGSMRMQLARRSIPEAPAHLVKSVPWREAVRLGVRGTPLSNLLCRGERPFSVFPLTRHFDRTVARRLRHFQPDLVYTYEDMARDTFCEAKKRGIFTMLEQSSNYWRFNHRIFAEEADRNPEFANLLTGLKDSPGDLKRKDEELQLADCVIAASKFVVRSLAGIVPEQKVRVIPYGAPEVRPRSQFNSDSSRPLKVLFVGNLAQHKGIGYLLQAVDLLGCQAELTMVGARMRPNPRVDAACRRWRWFESLPHDRVLDLMQQSDVLVLPSLSDAFGMVVTEALACGLPAIATVNTGASELLRDGRDGYVVPVCNAMAIAEKLETLHRDRNLLEDMSRQAQVTAANHSWEMYRAQWADAVRSAPWAL